MEIGRRALAAVLIVLMAIGSILLWLGIPVGWLYLVSRLVTSSQPSMGPYVLLLVGIPASMVVVGKGLSAPTEASWARRPPRARAARG
jgi:hypothetical protein